jgi:hypothetical protein
MNFIRTQPSSGELLERYARLPPGPKLVLRLKSLVFLPVGKTEFLECLTRGGLRMPDGKAWSSRSVNVALDQLLGQKLLTENLVCPTALLHPVAVDAAASGHAEMLVAAVRRTFPARRSVTYYSVARTIDRDALHRAIRLAIYANDGAAFTTNRDLFDKEWAPHRAIHFLAAMVAGVPLAVDWLASRHPAIQLALFEAKFFGFQSASAPDPDLPALIPYYRMLTAIEDIVGDERRAIEAAIAFLEGRNEAAVQCYRDALKLFRRTMATTWSRAACGTVRPR